ncbi:LysR substrate-binding domain-containing protein [Cupriavidus pauculus]|uniref:LysR substrate-binding domain-containing protein n=1 Tax=Cupriavidus pauculus TaxID=82633 RepID=UPI001EE26A2A|nr:LysR substrate-binding domain-containing protein [Cupriavidus pauculus]GJG95460.1 LysR family transcriptional regulator [Cupriavidus pauculus]
MRLPSLMALQMLECAARLGSFTRAAAELNVTESAISRQIQALEDRLGVRFFERVRQRVVLTPDGDRYVREIRAELKAIERATKDLASRAGGMEVLELAVVPTFATQWLIPRLAGFRAEHPRIVVNIHARPEPFHFADSLFDAAIYFGDAAWEGHPSAMLTEEGLSIPVCSRQLLQGKPPRKREDLLKLPLLHLASRPDAWPDWFGGDDEAVRRKARLGPRYDLFTMVTGAAICGLGVAVLPEMMVRSELESGRLVALPFAEPVESARQGAYFLTYRQKNDQTDKAALFADWLLRQCAAAQG